MKIGELFIALGIKADSKPLQEFSKEVAGITKSVGIVSAAVVAAAFALDKYIQSVSAASVAAQNFNQQTGLSIAKLQQWQSAGVLSNIAMTAEQVTASIQGLQNNLTQIKLGAGNASPFMMLGIDALNKDAYSVLDDIRKAIVGIDDATATNIIQQMGLNPNMISVLRKSNEEFAKLGKQSFLQKDQRDKLVMLGTELAALKIKLGLFFQNIGAASAPYLKVLFDFIEIFYKIGTAIKEFVARNEFLKTSFQGLKEIFGFIVKWIKTVLYVIEDLIVWAAGGNSAFKKMFEDAIKPVKTLWHYLEKIMGFKFPTLADAFDAVKKVSPLYQLGSLALGKQGVTEKNATVNNTYNIHSSERADDVADKILERQQKYMNYLYGNINSGVEA